MIKPRATHPPSHDRLPVRRALLSVYDKTGLREFAASLHQMGITLLSSGGTARHLRQEGLPVEDVSAVTRFPEILDGRVKTLHPHVHGGLLMRRGDPQDEAECQKLGIAPVDLVVINLYPFAEVAARPDVTDPLAAENIDIGGPAMVRAAAKNFAFVAAVTSPDQYEAVREELTLHQGTLSHATRRHLATEAFACTAEYDRTIARYFAGASEGLPPAYDTRLPMGHALRYGENPHQAAAFYGDLSAVCEPLHGKTLSYNNLLDVDAALKLIAEFVHAPPTIAILKHTNPCGVACAASLEEAYRRAFATDRQSPFGGIVAMNRVCSLTVAQEINQVFTEVVIAPEFAPDALAFLQKKKNRRLIRANAHPPQRLEARQVLGGMLCQMPDPVHEPAYASRFPCVTRRTPTPDEQADLEFAWHVVKHVKSNAIVYTKDQRTLGIGAGQMSRIDASELAVQKAGKSELDLSGSVMASDAFFPFADGLLAAVAAGARAVIQPGGSVRDAEVIAAADAHEVAMIFSGTRHFRH